jgi:capsid protein
MSWLDQIKSLFTRPLETKAATIPVGGYEGAQNYTTDRSYIYPEYSKDPGAFDTPEYARCELVRLTRYLCRNYAVVERILTVAENYSVGAAGISAQSATTDEIFNSEATLYWDDWARSIFASVSNEINLYDMEKLAVREILIAGEIFFVLTKTDSGYPQLIPVQSEQIRGTGKRNDKSVDGLFINEFGKVTAYQIYFGEKPTIVDAANVVHLKRVKDVNQKRGISAFAASLNSLRDHRDLQMAEKKAIKIHTALAVTVSKKSGEAADGLFGRGVTTTTTTPSDRPIPNRALEKAFSGAVVYMGENESVNPVASERSTDGFLKFLELLVRDVCMNISIPFEFVVNPSALTSAGVRFTISDADCLFKNLQNLLIDSGLQRIYTWVIASAVKDGKIKASQDKRFWTVNWVVPTSITIDQGRQDRSILDFVDNNLMSLDTYFSSRSKNWKDELRQIAQEKKFVQELEAEFGVSLKAELNKQAEIPTTPPQDNAQE